VKKILKKLIRPKFLILITTTIIAVFLAYVPQAQEWVSNNMTIVENWEKETNMPSSILIVFGVLVIGSFVYLIYDSLKESDTDRIESKLDELIQEIRRDRDERNNKSDTKV